MRRKKDTKKKKEIKRMTAMFCLAVLLLGSLTGSVPAEEMPAKVSKAAEETAAKEEMPIEEEKHTEETAAKEEMASEEEKHTEETAAKDDMPDEEESTERLPEIVSVVFSEPVTVSDDGKILYFDNDKNPLKVTVTVKGGLYGASSVIWAYTREKGVSETFLSSLEGTEVTRLSGEDTEMSLYTASFVLPLEKDDQLCGSITVTPVDSKGNTGSSCTDTERIVVVDSVSPKEDISFKTPDGIDSGTRYYGVSSEGRIDALVTVEEALFYPGDVCIRSESEDGRIIPSEVIWDNVKDDEGNETDTFHGSFSITGDGKYIVRVNYRGEENADRSGNAVEPYISGPLVIDTERPKVEVFYDESPESAGVPYIDRNGNTRYCCERPVSALIRITEEHFDPSLVNLYILAADVNGAVLAGPPADVSVWESSGNIHECRVYFGRDANYTFAVSCVDLAGNASLDMPAAYFTVDGSPPVITDISLGKAVLEKDGTSYYRTSVAAEVTAKDDISGVCAFSVSSVPGTGNGGGDLSLYNRAVSEGEIYHDGSKAVISFMIPEEALSPSNQFDGRLEISAFDRAGNAGTLSESRRLVVDDIAPFASVSFGPPDGIEDGTFYYDGSITGSILVTERNFYEEDTIVWASKDNGVPFKLQTDWHTLGPDTHAGSFKISDEGKYRIFISLSDRSGNFGTRYSSSELFCDSGIEKPVITLDDEDGRGKASRGKNAFCGSFSYGDENLKAYRAMLTMTRYDKTVDVTELFVRMDEKGGCFEIPAVSENDGIYTLEVEISDKAGHTSEETVTFTVNRFGSVYKYDDYLGSLIKDGGQYLKEKPEKDIVITQYSPERLEKDGIRVLLTRDGEKTDAAYTIYSKASDEGEIKDGWYEYIITIDKGGFEKDGIYKISLVYVDENGNTSVNSPYNSFLADNDTCEDSCSFTVDTTAPSIINIIGLSKPAADFGLIKNGKYQVEYTITDAGGIERAEVYLSGVKASSEALPGKPVRFSGSFLLEEKGEPQTVRIVAVDAAGNVTDTDDEAFDPAGKYVFCREILVTRNLLVRWLSNRGYIAAGLASAVSAVMIPAAVSKKKGNIKKKKK